MHSRILFFTSLISIVMLSFIGNSVLTVTSSAFKNNGMIPARYSCEGQEVSPPLQISNIPAAAKAIAIIVHDPDAPVTGGFTHWVMWNVATDGNVPEHYKGAEQGLNGAKQKGYKGMCPPSGTHHYYFMVYALDEQLNLDQNTDKAGLEKAMEGHILAKGELVGLYKKAK